MSVDLTIFDRGPYPADRPVVPAGREGDRWEYDEVVRFFTGKRIADVTYEALVGDYRKDWTAAHHLMSDQAFAFFLPALMRLSQDHYSDTSHNASVLADNLTFMFRRMAEGDMDHRLVPLLKSYSKQQLGAIAKFLREMSDEHYQGMGDLDDAAQALRLLWGRYLEQ
jgi:hypothetical protein